MHTPQHRAEAGLLQILGHLIFYLTRSSSGSGAAGETPWSCLAFQMAELNSVSWVVMASIAFK